MNGGLVVYKDALPEKRLVRIKKAIGKGDFWLVISDQLVATDLNKKIFCLIPTEGPYVPFRVGYASTSSHGGAIIRE